jgi:hypothetical protein
MHRYWLYAGDEYHPHGGHDDYITSRPTIEECQALCTWIKTVAGYQLKVDHKDWQTDSFSGHWMHIVDSRTGEKVYQMTSFKMKQDERESKDTDRQSNTNDRGG